MTKGFFLPAVSRSLKPTQGNSADGSMTSGPDLFSGKSHQLNCTMLYIYITKLVTFFHIINIHSIMSSIYIYIINVTNIYIYSYNIHSICSVYLHIFLIYPKQKLYVPFDPIISHNNMDTSQCLLLGMSN